MRLPDRPGSLGAVATVMGATGVDIEAVEIVEKGDGIAINDFVLKLPCDVLPDSLVSSCSEIEGVRVMWMSRVPDRWQLDSDIEALDSMVNNPERALEVLVGVAPEVFHCQWALALDEAGQPAVGTDLAPELAADAIERLRPLDQAHALELPADWTPGWGDTALAVVPASGGRTVVVGRRGGPVFLPSEVRRLAHLAAMA